MTIPHWQLNARTLARGIREGEFTAEAAVTSVLERIDTRNPAINAIVARCDDEALAAARKADDMVRRGVPLGPLHGVPVTIKINIDVQGQATTNGMAAYRNHIAPDHSPVVRHLLDAGAIIVGRTNTPELSMRATTDSPLHGRTRNPWHPEASPGGSSGGGGAAAAAGFGPIHHGNDIGGSLRIPSFACGVATVKPTQGRVPSFNPSTGGERGLLMQLASVQGVMCREVDDVRLGLEVISREDPRDPWWVPAPFTGPKIGGPIGVAVTRESHGYPVHPEILAGIDRAAEMLADAGYDVREVKTPSMERPAELWFGALFHEVIAILGPLAREHGSDTINRIFEWMQSVGEPVDSVGYRDAIAGRSALTREWSVFLAEHPLVLSPFLMRELFPWDYDARGEAELHDLFRAAIYSTGINFLGLPAGVVPIGLIDGLPCGVQLIGRRFREDLILDAMQAVEDRTGVLTRQLWAREV
ncbi:MAG: amidase [Gammaproteobacteria bacterium]|nr:amidase [Gammaproteobacteria bacterium]MYG65221.1 amidase [Gammaproteobacteria bacterium]